MKKIIQFSLLLFTCSSFSQELVNHKPFSILFVSPDSVVIDRSLESFADSLEKRHQKQYYDLLKAYEITKDVGSDEDRHQSALRLQAMRLREMEIYDFKFYDVVANETYRQLEETFNMIEKGPGYWSREEVMNGGIARVTDLFTYDLKILAEHYKMDYILVLENIHTVKKGEGSENIAMSLSATLYDHKEGKVIYKQDVQGNSLVEEFETRAAQHLGDEEVDIFHKRMRTHCHDYLDCILKNVIRSTTRNIYGVLSSRQRKE